MAGLGFRSHNDQIWVSVLGRHVALRKRTIRGHLPSLYELARPEIFMGYLHPEQYIETESHWVEKAIDIVFKYLKQLDQHSEISALLQTKLDATWRSSSWNRKDAEKLFRGLCHVFGQFGCNVDMSHVMASFFERHCAEIVQRTPLGWLKYIQGLDEINKHDMAGMTSALSCLLRHKKSINKHVVDDLARCQMISRGLAKKLMTLIHEKKRHAINNSLGIRGGAGTICGADLNPDRLHDIVDNEPQKLWLHPSRRSRRALYDEDFATYGLEPVECSNCDPTSPYHSDPLDRVPRILPQLDNPFVDDLEDRFGRPRRLERGMPVM